MYLTHSFRYRVLCSYDVLYTFFFGQKNGFYLFFCGIEIERERVTIEQLFEKLEEAFTTQDVCITDVDFALLCLQLKKKTEELGKNWNEEAEFRLRLLIRSITINQNHLRAAIEIHSLLGIVLDISLLLACAYQENLNVVIQVESLLSPEHSPIRFRQVRVCTPRYLLNRFQPRLVIVYALLVQGLRNRLRYLERLSAKGFQHLSGYLKKALKQGFHHLLKYLEKALELSSKSSQEGKFAPHPYMQKLQSWIECHDSKAVCCIDARVLAEVAKDTGFGRSFVEINQMDLFLPSGIPVQWLLKRVESVDSVVNELTLFTEIMQYCEENKKRVTLVGDDRNVLEKLVYKLSSLESKLDINFLHWVYLEDPENLSENERTDIQNSQPDIVLLSLPHPIQERWLVKHYHKLDITVVAVSDAFQLYSGSIYNPPKFIQKMCFEWLFHLMANPKRLGPHYFKAIPLFIFETKAITNNREVKILLQQISESVATYSK